MSVPKSAMRRTTRVALFCPSDVSRYSAEPAPALLVDLALKRQRPTSRRILEVVNWKGFIPQFSCRPGGGVNSVFVSYLIQPRRSRCAFETFGWIVTKADQDFRARVHGCFVSKEESALDDGPTFF